METTPTALENPVKKTFVLKIQLSILQKAYFRT